MSYLSDSEAALSARNHFVPLVVEHVHEAVRLVLTDQLRDIRREGGVLLQANAISCVQQHSSVTRDHKPVKFMKL